jgi:hypothetical protein
MELLLFVVLGAAIAFALVRLARASRRALPRAENSLAAAETDAARWIDRLRAGLTPPDGVPNLAAIESHTEAVRRYDSAREQLVRAASPYQASLAGRTAIEGLHYVRAMRLALGQDPGPEVPATGPQLERTTAVRVGGADYYAAPAASDAMPYYFPGGTVAGRIVPGGWYGQAWWRPQPVSTSGAVGIAG